MKLVTAGVVLVLVLVGAGVAVAIKLHHDSQVAARHRRAIAAQHAREQAAARARKARQAQEAQAQAQAQAQHDLQVVERQADESQLEKAITKDATQKANQGLLDSGPAQSTTCTSVSGGSSQDVTQSSGTYSCIAVYQTNGDGTQSGYRYSGTINFDTGEMTWQLGFGG